MNDNKVIIVLGGGVNHDGSICDYTIARLDAAITEYNKEPCKIISCGNIARIKQMEYEYSYITESEAMAKYLIDNGIPTSSILIENKSLDTIGNLMFARNMFLDSMGVRDVVVVTSNFFMARTKLVAKWVFGDDYNVSFIETDNVGLSNNHLETRKQVEEKILVYFSTYIMPNANDGDITSITNYMLNESPTYTGIENNAHEELLKEIAKVKESY